MKNNAANRCLTAGICILFPVATLLWAQEPWKNRPWTEWTKEEVHSVLTDSPWAHQLTVKDNLKGNYIVQWGSSVTVRQAWLREVQLEGQKAEIDTEEFLSERQDYEIHILPFTKGSFSEDMTDIPCGPPTFIQFGNGPKVQTHQVDTHLPRRVEFFFRRQVNNQPLFTKKEEKVVFQCGSVKFTFDLNKMLRKGMPDL